MRLGRFRLSLTSRLAPALGAMLTLGVLAACGGGGGAQPTSAPAPAAPSSPVSASPKPAVASPSPSVAVASASPSPSAIPGAQIYEVQPGDTLLSISEQFYGDATEWRRIYDANRDVIGDNPDALRIGMRLQIPPKT
jgi:5'-nucleotidase / UDP-sugar diphosphatase